MKRIATIFVVVILTLLAASNTASAQNRPIGGGGYYRTSYNGYRYGYINPIYEPYIRQLMRLPDALEACEIDSATAMITAKCRPIIKDPVALSKFMDNPGNSLLGTQRIVDRKLNFCTFDDTQFKVGKGTGGVLGAIAGVAIGSIFGKNGAIIGGVAGGAMGAVLGSKHGDSQCVPLQAVPTVQAVATEQTVQPQAPQQQPVAGPVETPTERKLFRNRFEEATVRVYNGSERILELTAGSGDEKEVSSSPKIWAEAWLENPKNGKMEWIPLQMGKGIDSLPQDAGWMFGNPDTKPSLQ